MNADLAEWGVPCQSMETIREALHLFLCFVPTESALDFRSLSP